MAENELVLVIAPDDGPREMLEFVMVRNSLSVAFASDGSDGLRKADALRPNVIVLDLKLQGVHGVDVVRSLQQGELASIPILVLTGRFTYIPSSDRIWNEPNVAGLLTQPFAPVELAAAVSRLLLRSRASRRQNG